MDSTLSMIFLAIVFLLQVHAAQVDPPSRCSIGAAPTSAYGSKLILQKLYDRSQDGARWNLDLTDGSDFWLEIVNDVIKAGHSTRDPSNDKIKWVFTISNTPPLRKPGQMDMTKVLKQEMFLYYDATKSVNVGCHEHVSNPHLQFPVGAAHPQGLTVTAQKVR